MSENSGYSLDLSVLVVTFNSAETIEACIQSVVTELLSIKGEVIVIDNHSTDDTPEILRHLDAEISNLKITLNLHNRGFASGNNQALDQAAGEHLFILNPDTVVHKGALSGLLDEMTKEAQTAITAPKLQFPDGRTQKSCRRFPTHLDVIYNSLGLAQLFPDSQHFNAWKMGDFDHESQRAVDQPAGAALMIRGSILRELKGFDVNFPMFFNDVDLCKRIKDAGYEIWFLPQYVLDHVGGASVKKFKLKMTVSSHVSFFRYLEKHFTRLYQQPLNFIAGAILYFSLIPRLLWLILNGGRQNQRRDTL